MSLGKGWNKVNCPQIIILLKILECRSIHDDWIEQKQTIKTKRETQQSNRIECPLAPMICAYYYCTATPGNFNEFLMSLHFWKQLNYIVSVFPLFGKHTPYAHLYFMRHACVCYFKCMLCNVSMLTQCYHNVVGFF